MQRGEQGEGTVAPVGHARSMVDLGLPSCCNPQQQWLGPSPLHPWPRVPFPRRLCRMASGRWCRAARPVTCGTSHPSVFLHLQPGFILHTLHLPCLPCSSTSGRRRWGCPPPTRCRSRRCSRSSWRRTQRWTSATQRSCELDMEAAVNSGSNSRGGGGRAWICGAVGAQLPWYACANSVTGFNSVL